MDVVVFGDDWDAHPSTTQHLVRAMGARRVLWVNSLGMRSPAATGADLKRAFGKLSRGLSPTRSMPRASLPGLTVIEPRVLPFHASSQVRAINRTILGHTLRRALRLADMSRPYVLAANPVAAYYLDTFAHARVAYLRLDDYPRLPGVDAELARSAEAAMHEVADVCFATASTLIPDRHRGGSWHALPQGVDVAHFAGVAAAAPESRVLGFFGLLAEWVDYPLIREVARANPDWTLELRGQVRHLPEDVAKLSNVRVLPAVPYSELPSVIGHWRAAWLPFVCNELTRGVNPLKLREYVAAGLPSFATPLPSVREIPHVTVGAESHDVSAWLGELLASDSESARITRRASMLDHGWQARATQLRTLLVT